MRKGRRKLSLLLLCLLFAASPVLAYRPFVSTDADVAEYHALEVETGLFGVQRLPGGRNEYIEPDPIVLNYGAFHDVEVVGQFDTYEPDGQATLFGDPELAMKVVLKDGVLQDKPGFSVALESTLLLSSQLPEERIPGFEEAFIFSNRYGPVTFHLNLGGGTDQTVSLPYAAYGLISEMPLSKRLRLADEINGQEVNTQTPDNSNLVGLLWEPYWKDVVIDFGWRKGLSAISPSWSVQAGISFAISLERRAAPTSPVSER